jgi:demethylmenaquinone methyltransferase/2-methoxy-6-polyprenyl-1,4-benzoquinol methylase
MSTNPKTTPEASEGSQRLAPHTTLAEYYGSDERRQGWVNSIFDETAQHYDWICRVMSFGTGQRGRRIALENVGLAKDMKILDVATGTGGVALGAEQILQGSGLVVALDPSIGMLQQCRKNGVAAPLVQGRAEILPLADAQFDLLSMGYALRHVPDLKTTFGEYFRVLKPGGKVLILEITRPRSAFGMWLLKVYMKVGVPLVTRWGTGSAQAARLMRYYWDTISGCVPPETILDAMRSAGFADVTRNVMGGILSEYVGRRP